jgi:squalene-hopene/tetraprenyl-beta-curcumene cyclase
MSLAQAHIGPDDPMVKRAVAWLKQKQNADGGWGESNDSYALQARPAEDFGSTPYQTAWALLGLLSAGEAGSEAARRVRYEIAKLTFRLSSEKALGRSLKLSCS